MLLQQFRGEVRSGRAVKVLRDRVILKASFGAQNNSLSAKIQIQLAQNSLLFAWKINIRSDLDTKL